MSGFWNELRASTEAEAQRSNEAFARGANIVNMLNQATESDLGRSMNYENMAQSGLLSMASLAENSRQFDTGHKYAMELGEQDFVQAKALAAIQNKYAIILTDLQNEYDMKKQLVDNEHELKVLDKELQHKSEAIVTEQNHEQIQLLNSFLLSEKSDSKGGSMPHYTQIYNNVMNRGRN